jgi:hypothetical protein
MDFSKVSKIILSVMVIILSKLSEAQGVVGFFTQKQTQTQYLIQQIASLKVYAAYIKQGYKVVDGGLNAIGKFKGGHLELDKAYFDGQISVHPKVKAQALNILNAHSAFEKQIAGIRNFTRKSNILEKYEKEFSENLLTRSQKTLNNLYTELEQVLDHSYKMTDDERLRRVEQILFKASELFELVKKFGQDIRKLEIQKKQEAKDVKVLKELYR